MGARWMLLMISLGVLFGGAIGAEELDLPEKLPTSLESARIYLSFSEFRDLMATLAQFEKEEVPKRRPPRDFGVTEVQFDATVDGNMARIEAEYRIQVWDPEGWVSVPILGGDVAPISGTMDGKPVSLAAFARPPSDIAPDTPWQALTIDAPGTYTVELTFLTPVTTEDGVMAFEFQIPPTSLAKMNLRLPYPEATVEAPRAAGVTQTAVGDSLQAEMAFLPTSRVEVSWTRRARAAAPDEPAQLSAQTATLATVSAELLHIRSVARIDVLRGATDSLRIRLPRNVNVMQVTGADIAWEVERKDGDQILTVRGSRPWFDTVSLAIEGEIPLDERAPTATIPYLIVEDVVRETGFVGVAAQDNIELEPGPVIQGVTAIDTADLPSDIRGASASPILLAYEHDGGAYLLPIDIRREPPRLASDAATLALVGEGHLGLRSQVRIDVLRGAAESVRMRLPRDVNILEVQGDAIGWNVDRSNDEQLVTVRGSEPWTEAFDLDIHYEHLFDKDATEVTVPALSIDDIVRETGNIGIAARGNVEIKPSPVIEGVTRMDPSELPSRVQTISSNPIMLAYRYSGMPYLLPLNIRRLEDAPVRVAGIDRAHLTTVIAPSGIALSRATFHVQNNMQQFLRVHLPEGAELWGAEIGDRPVKPARENDSDTLLLPLLQSRPQGSGLGSFPVAVIYFEQRRPLGKTWDDLDLTAPRTDMLINEMLWDVYLPEEIGIYRATGDLDRDARRRRTSSLSYSETSMETLGPLREGIERFFITDINNPAASIAGGTGDRYQGDPVETERPLDPGTIAGMLPISITLPVTGTAHSFSRIVVPSDTPMTLSLQVYGGTVHAVGRYVVGALSIVMGIFIMSLWAHALRAYPDHGTAAVLLLIAGAILAGAALYYVPSFRLWIGLGIGGAVVRLIVLGMGSRRSKSTAAQPGEVQ